MSDPVFEQVAATHHAMLFRFALSLTRDQTEACDLTQETFYIWAKKGHQLRDSSKLKSWLLTTLRRQFLMRRRHAKRFPHYELSLVEEDLPPATPQSVDQMDSAHIMEALQEVEDHYRAPLMLFYFQDHSYKEIADILEIPTGTVMSWLARGKEQIRHILARKTRSKTFQEYSKGLPSDIT